MADLLSTERRSRRVPAGRDTDERVLIARSEGRHDPFPLTEMQFAYWIGRQGGIELGEVGNHGYAELDCADLDLGRLTGAWRRLIERHDMLRTVLLPDGRQQILAAVPPYDIPKVDLRMLSPCDAERGLAETRERMSHQVRCADHWPLFELLVSILGERRMRLHISMDLLVCDLESLDVLFRELIQLYADPSVGLPALEISFRDWVLAQPALLGSAAYCRSEAYWRERVSSLPLAPALPLARNPAAISRPRFTRRGGGLDRDAWKRLKERITRAGLTPTGLLAAAYAEILATWSESPNFCLNLPVSNRPPIHPQIGDLVGCFSSFVLLEVDASTAEPFAARALRLQTRLWHDLEHRQACGVWMLRELSRLHGRAPGGLMPVVFTSTLGIARDSAFASLDPLGETVFEVTQTPQVWLDYLVYEQDGDLRWDWDAVEAVFPPGLLDDMFEAHSDLLKRLADEDGAWRETAVSRLPAWQLRLREAVNDTAAPVTEVGLWELFRRQAAERPEAVAVVSGEVEISYRELARRAWQLAARLRRAGVRRDQPVAVVMEKGWEQVVAVLAALAADAPYLPLDPHWPRARLRNLLEGAGVAVALTQARLATGLAWPTGVSVLEVEPAPVESEAEIPEPSPAGSPQDLAYVIFTSGSTGRPKGVQIEQRSVVNRIFDVNARFGIGPGDRAFAVTALHHDLAVYDLFGMLAAGGAVVLPEPSERPDPECWIELLRRSEVTLWNSVPAFFEMLVSCLEAEGERAGTPPPLRRVLLSGDWIPVSLPDRARALMPGLQVIGLGGPTETTVWDICFPIGEVDPQWRSIPYGRPMANARYHILDSRLAPRPVWVPGEIYIAGTGLARGLLNEEATGGPFLLHPETGERLYRSGDLGRFFPDGTIELLGRDDLQVKVQGQRIELGEIEAELARHPRVQGAVVTLAEGGRLIAFVVPAGRLELAAEAAERLARKTGAADPRPGSGPVIPLERPEPGEAEVGRYLARRSYRRFSRQPVPLESLGGWVSCLRQLELEGVPFPKYRYPSGGGLYPVQAYLHVKPGRAEGIPAGAYYYHPGEHRLILLSAGAPLDGRLHLEVNRLVYEECAFSLFLVAQMKAIAPVYGEAAAEFCFLEAGYMSQLLMSEAPRHGIGLCPVGQLDFAPLRGAFVLEESHILLHTLLGGGIEEGQKTVEGIVAELAALPGSVLSLPAELRVYLRDRLPAHLVPAMVEVVDTLPLTGNGKIDRGALAARRVRYGAPAFGDPPRTELEKTIACVWLEVLGLEAIGMHDNFFELGGSSLHLVQVYRRLKERFPGLSTRELFRQATIHALARFLGETSSSTGSTDFSTSARRAEMRRGLRQRRTGD